MQVCLFCKVSVCENATLPNKKTDRKLKKKKHLYKNKKKKKDSDTDGLTSVTFTEI